MSATARFSIRAAIASHLGEGVREVEGRRYQPTRTPCAVYAADNEYLTATRAARKPRETADHYLGSWQWVEVPVTGYAKAMGWHIWRAKQVCD